MGTSSFSISQDIFENQYYSFEFKNGILEAEYKDNLKIGYEDARIIVEDRLTKLGDISYPVLIKSAKKIKLSPAARKYLFTKGTINFRAMAFIEKRPLESMLTNAFLKLLPISIPCRTFSDRDSALTWLSQYIQPEDEIS